MKRWFAVIALAAAMTAPCLHLIWIAQNHKRPPASEPKSEHELQPDIRPCLKLDGDAWVDCATGRTG